MAYRLSSKHPPAQALARCINGEIRAAADTLRTGKSTAIHEARKHLKKARSALRLARRSLPKRARKDEIRALSEIARQLAPQRDLQVASALLRRWLKSQELEPPARAATNKLLTRLSTLEHGTKTKPHKSITARLRKLTVSPASWKSAPLTWKHLHNEAIRSHRRAQQAMHAYAASRRPGNLHRWRKRTKDLLYHLRLLNVLLRRPARKLPKRLDDLSEMQGQFHDLVVLRQLARPLGYQIPPAERRALEVVIKQKLRGLRLQILNTGKQVLGKPPAKFAKQLRKSP